jgi:DNA-binding MarR family transcriptional regulator
MRENMSTRSPDTASVPDLGVLAARMYLSLQRELFRSLAERGFADLRPRHGAVLAFLDRNGVRGTELARMSGQHKQIIGTIVDELEALGYVQRRPDPADRRAKLVFPTERGLAEIRAARRIIKTIEARHAKMVGREHYEQFKATLHSLTETHQRTPPP